MAATIKQLKEERATIIAKARKINDDHADKDGKLAAEHQQAFDLAMGEAGEKMDAIKRLEQLESAESTLSLRSEGVVTPANPALPFGAAGGDGAREKVQIRSRERGVRGEVTYRAVEAGTRGQAAYRAAYSKYLQHGAGSLSPTEVAALRSDDASQAGYLVSSEQFTAEILKNVDDLVFVRQFAQIDTVREADALGIRRRTAKLNSFDWTTELQLATEDSTLAYGKKVLTPHPLTGRIKVSRDLVRRSMESIDSIVGGEFARDSAEKMEDAYLLGNGNQRPLGVFVASTDGVSTARDVLTGSATNFTADQLIAAKYTLKQQYRTGGERQGARWLFHRDGISKIAQLKDANNQYLLHPDRGLTGDEFDRLLGYPVDESERAPNTFTTGLYVGMLCNWGVGYRIADALDMEVQVLDQLYAETNQIGYIGRMKTDGMPVIEEAFVRLKTS